MKQTTNKQTKKNFKISQVHRIIYKWVKANRIIMFNCSLTETLQKKIDSHSRISRLALRSILIDHVNP